MIYPQKYGIKSDRTAAFDLITEAHVCKSLVNQFGPAIIYGTMLVKEAIVEGNAVTMCCENQYRKYFKNAERVVEIGTKFGVGSLIPAHYANHLTTIDIMPRTEPLAVWDFFGVNDKITYAVVENDKEKKDYLNGLDFDFAIIDADHTPKGVRSDFERVKKCGRVLFHEYIFDTHPNNPDKFKPTIDFLKTLPQDEMTYDEPFAYWEKR